MATASVFVLCLGTWREPIQRKRHTQIAITVTASQTRLRVVSIVLYAARPNGSAGTLPYSASQAENQFEQK